MPRISKHIKQKNKTNKLSCQDYALFLLSLRAQSVKLIAEKLKRKGYEDSDIDSAIQRLSELGYLNDAQFAQIFFDNLVKYKSFGYFGIKKKLAQKKIESKIIDKLLKQLTLKEESEIARRLLDKAKNKTYEQKVRALQSKGFRSDVIFKLTKAEVEY